MIDAKPAITPAAVKSILQTTAVRWADGGKNNDFGAGRLQAYQAIARAAAITQNLNPPEVPRVRFQRGNINPGEQQTFTFNVVSTRFPIAITVVALNYPSTNIDLELIAPTGTVVARSTTGTRQDTVRIQPGFTGLYTLRLTEAFGTTPFLLNISGDIQ